MDTIFKPVHLLLSELNYELRIRNVISNRNQDDKRKILARLLEKERKNSNINLLDPEYDFDRE